MSPFVIIKKIRSAKKLKAKNSSSAQVLSLYDSSMTFTGWNATDIFILSILIQQFNMSLTVPIYRFLDGRHNPCDK